MLRLGLATRLALTVALFMVPAAAWVGLSVQEEREQVAESVEARLNVRLTELVSGVEGHFLLAQQTLRILAEVPELHADAATCNQFLAPFGRIEGEFLAFARARPDGVVDCATPGMQVPLNVGHRSHFHETMATGNFTVGSFRYEDYAGLPVVTTAYPIHDEEGELEGAVMTASTVATVLQLDRVQALPEGSVVTVTDAEGVIIARSGPAIFTGETFGDRERRMNAELGEIYRARGVDGIERLYVTNRSTLGGAADALLVSAGVPVDAAYAPVVQEAVREVLFLVGLLVLMGAAGSLAFHRVVLRPVKQIAATAGALQGGDRDARVPPAVATRSDEVGHLATVLNAMAEEVRHQLQALEHANLRLDQVDILKTQIINTVAHELRTPLVSLKLQVALLQKHLPPGDAAGDALARVERNLARLDRLIQSIIKVAKILADRIDLAVRPVPTTALLEKVKHQWTSRAHEADLTFEVVSTPAMVQADPYALREVLDELLDNAFKFTPPGGSVRVRVTLHEQDVLFTVEDTGVGLREGAFDVDSRLEPHGEPARGGRIGVGLGLFIARALMEQMGGSLSHESAGPNQGTRAVVRVPAG